jgi:hypothetical protein
MKTPISRAALAVMTLDEYRTHYPEVASGEVLEALYADRLVAFDEDQEPDACSRYNGVPKHVKLNAHRRK